MACSHLGIVDALVGAEHDRAGLAASGATEVLVDDVEAARALDVGQGELGPVVGPGGAHDAAEDEEGRDPGDQDADRMGMAPTAKAGKHESLLRWAGGGRGT